MTDIGFDRGQHPMSFIDKYILFFDKYTKFPLLAVVGGGNK
jgi:hypothetical protein